MLHIKQINKLLISCFCLFVLSCEKYYQEDLITLEEMSVLGLEYHNGDLSQDYIVTYFESKGYRCYFNGHYDDFFYKNLTNDRSIVYEKAKYLNEGKILNTIISVSKNSKVFKVSIDEDVTNDVNANIEVISILLEIQVFDMQEYDMTKYDSVYDFGR